MIIETEYYFIQEEDYDYFADRLEAWWSPKGF